MYGFYSFAPSGRFYCCTFVRRALPWVGVSLPLRGVGSLTFRRICYPPEQMRPALELARFQNKVEKEGPTISQPKASPWVFVYTSVSPRRGKRMKSSFPFPQPSCMGFILLPLSGRFYCCTFVRRALPWVGVSLPLRGANCSGGYVIRLSWYPPRPSPREGGSDR